MTLQDDPPALLELVEIWLNEIDAAPATKRTYRTALRRFDRFLATAQERPIGSWQKRLHVKTLVNYRSWLAGNAQHMGRGKTPVLSDSSRRGYNRRTVRNALVPVARYLRWLDAGGLLPAEVTAAQMEQALDVAQGNRRLHYNPKPVKEGVPLLVSYYDELELPPPNRESPRTTHRRLAILRNRALLRLLFASGARAFETAGLKREDWQPATQQLYIRGKGDKDRSVPLDEDTAGALSTYFKERDRLYAAHPKTGRADEPIFARHDPGVYDGKKHGRPQPVSTITVWQVVIDAVEGLRESQNVIMGRVTPHDFRRYIATYMLNNGMRLEQVQEFLGHADPSTTRTVYAASTWQEAQNDAVSTFRPTLSEARKRAGKHVVDRDTHV
jgi:integrase